MNIKDKLNKVYSLYEKWDYNKAKEINDNILKEDPNNIYANKYQSLLLRKLKTFNKKEITRVKWKQMKCPHCNSKIWFSALTNDQRLSIKNWNYNNLEIKCPYCHTKFILQKRKANSILWLKIWDKAIINNKTYRVTWYIEYVWTWYEWRYSGRLWYLEWILLWDKWEYIYFSEWFFEDDWVRENEFELSSKVIPKNKIDLNWYKEKNKLVVKSIYWENSKSFIIWEKVEIFDYWNYVLEKEWSWRQKEVWFYTKKSISHKEACNIFNKEFNIRSKVNWWDIVNFIIVIIVIIVILSISDWWSYSSWYSSWWEWSYSWK